MGVRVGALAPVLGVFMRPPGVSEDGPVRERRRYPPPELEIGVIAAFKIAGIILAPLSIIAALFALYLQGFRADLRLDMQKVVSDALDKHELNERQTFATLSSVAGMHEELDRLRREHDDLERTVVINTGAIQRLLQKNGIPK